MANCRTLQHIDINTCTGNKGGIYTEVIIASRSALQPVPDTTQGHEGLVKFNGTLSGVEALMLRFRKQSSGLTSEGTFDEANGVSYFTNNLNLVFAHQDVEKRMAIQALALANDLAVLLKDGNNEIIFLGMDDTVSTTALTAQTGTATSDGNNYAITLTDTSNELPYYVSEADWNTLYAIAKAEIDPNTSNNQ